MLWSPRMRRGILVAVLGALVIAPVAVFLAARSGGSATSAPTRITYGQVQSIFNASCVGCHPSVNPSLDLTPRHSYASLINTTALEDPNYVSVALGDPRRSFLYLMVAGFEPAGEVGGRMPLRAAPLSAADVRLISEWIAQGARGP